MSSFKALSAALVASVAVHAFFIYSLLLPGEVTLFPDRGPIPIQIDEVRYEKLPPLAPHKPVKGIPIPRLPAPAGTSAIPPAEFRTLLEEKIKMQRQQLERMEQPETPAPRVASSMSSTELLNDPQKGKVFLGYFSQVKKKIQNTVYQKAGSVYGRGSVCLAFVLDARGELEALGVVEKGTNADGVMRELAKRCLRESAPFGDFPKDLGPGRVAFNITIFFDSSD